MKKKNRSFKQISNGIQTEHLQSLKATAKEFNLYYKCNTIAYWLMTSHIRKGFINYNICSTIVHNQRIRIEADTNHNNLQVYLNDSLKVKVLSRRIIKLIPSDILFSVIDLLFERALKEKRRSVT